MTYIDIESVLAFDTETTGLDTDTDRILTGSLAAGNSARTWIINPGIEIPPDSEKIHGISNDYIQEHGGDPKQSLIDICQEINQTWGNGGAILAHNMAYDFSILAAECRRYDLPEFAVKGPVLDSMVLSRMLGHKKAKLSDCADRYGIVNENAHSSESDAITTWKVLRAMLESSVRLRETDLRDLYTEQRVSHRSWAQGLQQFFDRTGKKEKNGQRAVVSEDWPIKPYEESK